MTANANKKTTMRIKEVHVVEAGEKKGDLVINVEAKRGANTYALPYQIAAKMIPQFDFDNLMAKVRQDIDAKENDASQTDAVIEKLKGMMTDSIALD